MSQFIIEGGRELKGSIKIGGAKNAVLPILAASVLANDVVTLRNVPNISDVQVMVDVLRKIGIDVTLNGSTIIIVPSEKIDTVVPDIAAKIRFSIVLIGAIVARMGEVHIPMPTGDKLGERRIDQHILALEQFGAEVNLGETHIHARAHSLQGRPFVMTFPSVSGTENSVLLACAAEGTSTISGIALEPEVQSFMHFLRAIGGRIDGIGTDTVTVYGKSELGGAEFEIIPDRLEAMTYAQFVGAVGGEVLLCDFDPVTLGSEWEVLSKVGLILEKRSGDVWVYRDNALRLHAIDVKTGRYPLFYTDLQPVLVALLALANGKSTVVETLYGTNRFQYVPQLKRMNAQIEVRENVAMISGISRYKGAEVEATDIRAGAALTLAALSAEGKSVIHGVEHIDRGYEYFESKLQQLGADIIRAVDTFQ